MCGGGGGVAVKEPVLASMLEAWDWWVSILTATIVPLTKALNPQ